MMQLSVRRKLLLLLVGTLIAAFGLAAVALGWLIERHHETLAGATTRALLRDLGVQLSDQQRRIAHGVETLSGREDIVGLLAQLSDASAPEYATKVKALAEELHEYAEFTDINELGVYDSTGNLISFERKDLGDPKRHIMGVSIRENGKRQWLGTDSNVALWQALELPDGVPTQVSDFGLPTTLLIQMRRHREHLALETIAAIQRMHGGKLQRLGWIRLSHAVVAAELSAFAQPRNLTLDLLFSGNFTSDNRFGLRPDQLAIALPITTVTRVPVPVETIQHPGYYLDFAALTLAGGEQAWLVAAQERGWMQQEQRRTLVAVMLVLAGSLLLAVPLAGWAGRRWIGIPFDKLHAGVHAYTQGQLETAINLHTGDEFEILAEEFNLLAVALRVREIAIKEAEERWQFALEGAGHGVWDLDGQTGKTYYSPRWKTMLGYADDEINPSFDEWLALIHPEDRTMVQAEINRHLSGVIPIYRAVYRLRAKDGGYRWVLAQGRIVRRDSNGTPLRTIGTHTDITEQRRTQEKLEELMVALKESETHYRAFFVEVKAAMLLVDPSNGRIIDANPAASTFYGYSHDELLALHIGQINQLPEEEIDEEMTRAIIEKRDHFIFPHRLKNGAIRSVEVYSGPYHQGDRLVLYSIIHDITDRIEAERGLREAATVFNATSEAIMITDAHGIIKRVNPAFVSMTGYAAAEAVGQSTSLLKSGHHDSQYYEEMWGRLLQEGRWEGEVWNRRKSGEIFPVWQIVSSIKEGSEKAVEFVSLFIDITQKKRSEAEIAYRANYDALTGLPNRNLLAERLGQSLKQARRENSRIAVMFVDLDFFKQVNDTLGHAIGDRLLQAVAERMRLCVRETDTIARQGGDEFVVLLADIEDAASAGVVAEKIITQMSSVFEFENHEIHIGASIGITLFPEDGRDLETLFRNADLAMYRAKAAGRNNAQFFEMAMTTAAISRRVLEADLRGALARGEFTLHYQPVVNLAVGRIIGAEALLRWQHPQRGLVSPDQFIPLAEETGLIREIGTWVFGEACRQLATWQAAGHQLTLAINVSVRQLPDALSMAHILTTLMQHQISPRQIVLEITEGVLLADSPAVQTWFLAAGAAGLQLAIDDFGTGYSSLAYLKRFPVHHVKIDKSFVRDIATDPADRALVEAILAMAHSLNLSVVAEGVETEEQAHLLRARNCELAQGYLYSRPVPADDFQALLATVPHAGHGVPPAPTL